MKYESYTEQMNSVPLKKRFSSQSKTSPTHPEFNMTTSPTQQHSPPPTTPPTMINTITTPSNTNNNNNQNIFDSSNDSMMITTTIDNSTILPPSTPIKEEVKTEKSLNALLSPTSTTIDALASLHLQSVSATNSPSNESTTTTTSSSTCNSSPEDSGSNRKEPTTSSTNTNSSTSVTDSPNSSSKKRRQFINRANKKKEDRQGDSDSGEESDDSENDSSEEDETLYCKCNRPASYGWMIACDRCDKWFHGRCLGLKKYQANSISTYICPDCESSKKRKSTSINPSPSKSGRNNKSEISASSLAKDLPPKQITNHL